MWLERIGMVERADHAAGTLPYGAQRRLELARAMCTDPVLLGLDEPAPARARPPGPGAVPEGRRIFPRMTVLENLQMGAVPAPREHFQADLDRVFELFPILAERQKQRGGMTIFPGRAERLPRAGAGAPRLRDGHRPHRAVRHRARAPEHARGACRVHRGRQAGSSTARAT